MFKLSRTPTVAEFSQRENLLFVGYENGDIDVMELCIKHIFTFSHLFNADPMLSTVTSAAKTTENNQSSINTTARNSNLLTNNVDNANTANTVITANTANNAINGNNQKGEGNVSGVSNVGVANEKNKLGGLLSKVSGAKKG